MHKKNKRFFLLNLTLIPGILGFILSGVLSLFLYNNMSVIPLWGAASIVTDTILSAFFLPLIVCLLITPLITKLVQKGRLKALENADQLDHHLPLPVRNVFLRAALIGSIGVMCAAAPILLLWEIFWPEQILISLFMWLKAGFTAVLIALMTCLASWWVLIDASQQLIRCKRGVTFEG